MANIALDIKANTQKALGEFKKLSRELDNKFLVQGLKLDVVKGAFSQINKEFENAVGSQGLKTAESTGQLKRSLAASLFDLKRFGTEAQAAFASEEIVGSLQRLRAEGEITGQTFREALNIGAFLDFDATGSELQQQLTSATSDIAKFVQKSSDIFSGSQGQLFLKGVTGQLTSEQLSDLDFNLGGNTNQILGIFRNNQKLLRSQNTVTRTEGIMAAVKELEALDIFDQALAEIRPIEFVLRKISGLFSETGLFGALRVVGGVIENFDKDQVNRNLLQVTGKLLRTIFDTEEGVFAKLNQALQKAFGNFDVLEPILSGAEFLTGIFKKLGNFFESSEFQSFLDIFDGFVAGIKGILSGGGLDFSAENVNKLISGIFDSIKGLIGKIIEFIKGLDAKEIGSVIATIADGIAELIPVIITLVSEALAKASQAFGEGFAQADFGGKAVLGAALTDNVLKLFTGEGIFGNIKNLFKKGLEKLNPFQRNRDNNVAAGGSDKQRWSRLYELLEEIRKCVCRNNNPISQLQRLLTQGAVATAAVGVGVPLLTGGVQSLLSPGKPRSLPGAPRFQTPRVPGGSGQVSVLPRGGVPGAINVNATPVSSSLRAPAALSRVSKALGGIGRLAGPLAAAIAAFRAFNILNSEKSNREKTKGVTGIAGGLAAGAAGATLGFKAGGIIGSFFGPGVGTAIGAAIGTGVGGLLGAVLGEKATNALFDPVVDGVTELGTNVGSFFSDIWKDLSSGFSNGLEGIGNFFGPEGPIAQIGQYLFELPGNILGEVKTKFEEARQGFADLPGNLLKGIQDFFGGGGENNKDPKNPKNNAFLGGAKTGLTLVGENGPELVNLGSGANVIPNSSLMGGLYGNAGGRRAEAPVTNNITINVNAPVAEEFAEQLTDAVIVELDRQYNLQRA